MSRRARFSFTLPDGRLIGYGFKERGNILRVQFRHPTEDRYIEASTGCASEAEAHTQAAKIVLKAYSPTLPPDPRTATWEQVLADLEAAVHLREMSFVVYESIVSVLRSYVPTSKGPNDITPEIARQFRAKYGSDTFTRSPKPDAKRYKRSPKTVENAVRRLSALWVHLQKLNYVTSNPWLNVPRPTVPKKAVTIPDEDNVQRFFKWVRTRYPDWPLFSLYLDIKALAGCRTYDLCCVRTADLDPKNKTLTIRAEDDKTHRERVVPLPPDLFKKLREIAGPTYLWESYTEAAKVYRPGSKNRDTFTPRTLYWSVKNLFREFAEEYPQHKVKPHDLRKRAITLTVQATQSIDQTADAIGIDPSTARRYYLDTKQAFDGAELLKKMAGVLRPKKGK